MGELRTWERGSRREMGGHLVGSLLALVLTCSTALAMGARSSQSIKVGDEEGWALPPGSSGQLNYTSWAQQKAFHVGDTVVFQYNPGLHNVLQVGKEDYERCNTSGPLIQFSSGNTVFPLTKSGVLYFVCGILDHCLMGQKVAIKCFDSSPSKHSPITSGSKSPDFVPPPFTSTPTLPTIPPSPNLDQPSPSTSDTPYFGPSPSNSNTPYPPPFGETPPPLTPSNPSSPSSWPSPSNVPPPFEPPPSYPSPCGCQLFPPPPPPSLIATPPPAPLIATPPPPSSHNAPPPSSSSFTLSHRIPSLSCFYIILLLLILSF